MRAPSTSVPVATSQTRNAPSGSAAADRSKAPSGENCKETTHPPARSCRISFRHAPVDASHIQTTHSPGPLASARTSDADADAIRLVSCTQNTTSLQLPIRELKKTYRVVRQSGDWKRVPAEQRLLPLAPHSFHDDVAPGGE